MAKSSLVVTERDAACVVDFRDETVLDHNSVPAVTEDLYHLVDNRQAANILLDLSAVRFLSSPMIGTLVALHKKTLDHGGQIVLCGLSSNLFRVFQVSRLTAVLHFAPCQARRFATSVCTESPGSPSRNEQPAHSHRGF